MEGIEVDFSLPADGFLARPRRGFHMAELALDHTERMLDLGLRNGDEAFGALVEGMPLATHGGLPQALLGPANATSRSALTWPLLAQTEVSSPRSILSQT